MPDRCARAPVTDGVGRRIRDVAGRAPDRLAVDDGRHRLRYDELVGAVDTLAAELRGHGVGPEVLVGVHLPRESAKVVALLAVLEAGGAYVPIEWGLPPARIAVLAEQAPPALVLTAVPAAPPLADLPALDPRPVIATAGRAGATGPTPAGPTPAGPAPAGPTPAGPAPADLAYVVFTSGSTGRPKGVAVEHAGLCAHLDELDAVIRPPSAPARPGHGPGTFLATTGIGFDPSVVELLWTLTRGWTVALHDVALGTGAFAEALTRSGATHLQGTPTLYRMLLADPRARAALAGRTQALVGGEHLTPALARALCDALAGGELVNLYGPTETTVWSTAQVIDPARPVTVGRAMTHTTVEVMRTVPGDATGDATVPGDATGDGARLEPVAPGELGEVVIGGAGVARGYWNQPELTAAAFVRLGDGRRVYRTGDLGRFDPDGRLVLAGRADHQVKIRGHRIELGEVESVIEELSGVRHAVVVVEATTGRPITDDGVEVDTRVLVAHVLVDPDRIARSGAEPLAAVIAAELRRRLPGPLLPAAVRVTDHLPRTATGKVDRSALPPVLAPADQGTATPTVVTPTVPEPLTSMVTAPVTPTRAGATGPMPTEPLATEFARVWSAQLGRRVTPTDDVFSLGASSVDAARVFLGIEQRHGVRLPLAALVDAPTPTALAALVALTAGDVATGPGPAVAATRSWDALVWLRRPAAAARVPVRAPLVCVHGRAGNVLTFLPLVERTGRDRVVLGLQAVGLDGCTPPHTTVEAMADHYVSRLLDPAAGLEPIAARPGVVLCGYSGGGIVAVEMARRLRSRGVAVPSVVLLDTVAPGEGPLGWWGRLDTRWREDPAAFPGFVVRWTRDRVRARLGRLPAVTAVDLGDAFDAAVVTYRPAPIDGRLLLVRTRDRSRAADLGWRRLVSGDLDVACVPGGHVSLLRPPHVQAVATAVRHELARADAARFDPIDPITVRVGP
jgi:amino acid adenylation domain-containing protein